MDTINRQRTWTKIGADYTASIEHVWAAKFDELEWITLPKDGKGLTLPMCQGEAIKAAIKELRIPKVSHIAWNGVYGSGYGVYGIRGHYKNGAAEIFILDEGSRIVVLCSDLYPNE
jgi:hypothetical protein